MERHGRGVLLTERGLARVANGEADLGLVHNWNSVPLVIPEHLTLEWLCEDVADVLVHREHPLAERPGIEPAQLLRRPGAGPGHQGV